MLIKDALVYHETEGFIKHDIAISGEFLTAQTTENEVTISGEGLYAIPGLIDIHMHGSMKADYASSSAKEITAILEYEAANGITSVCATTMTLSEDMLTTACRSIKQSQSDTGAAIVGINLEGPFLSADKLGAQNPLYLSKPDLSMFHRLQQASGNLIKILDLAPEVEGAMELIEQLHQEVRCSIAHTTADYDTALKAFSLGASHVTHLYNAMPPLSHRSPGVIGAARDMKHVTVELICDGIHVHPSVVRATFEMFGDDRVILISDSMMATGLTDGLYELGGLPVTVSGNVATLAEGGNIAGSVTNLMKCLKTAVQTMNIPLSSAVKAATVNPAKAIGIFDQRGSIDDGKYADLVLLDQDLNIRHIILRGHLLKPWTAI